MEKRRLGRGLDALLASTGNGPHTALKDTAADHSLTRIAVERIDHNPYQPRQVFDDDDLAALSDSIRAHGILQPLVVRRVGDRYQLIAGERRLRAAQAVGHGEVPVQVVDFND